MTNPWLVSVAEVSAARGVVNAGDLSVVVVSTLIVMAWTAGAVGALGLIVWFGWIDRREDGARPVVTAWMRLRAEVRRAWRLAVSRHGR